MTMQPYDEHAGVPVRLPMDEITLNERGRMLTLRLTHDQNASLLRVLALYDGQEIGDIRIRWDNGMLYIDVYDADEIAKAAEVPAIDMHVLWSDG
jgi:hypothetical protein